MGLDPVHFEGITRHARRIGSTIDEQDQRAFAETVWREFLDPLRDDSGEPLLRPVDEQYCREIDIEGAALESTAYEVVHGLDSGTINPTSFKNGLVLDVAQAAMAVVPSDLDTHRYRTLVTAVHTDDASAVVDRDEQLDEGYVESQLLRAPAVSRFEESVVHELALYLAESTHALSHFERVEDLFVLDGPIYPKGMLNWADRDPELEGLLHEERGPRDVIENYLRLVERAIATDRPIIGFVKNPATKALTRTLRTRTETPWVDDTAFFRRILEQVSYDRTVDANGTPRIERRRETDSLTYTNWFRSRGGADGLIAEAPFGIDRKASPEAYEVTFFALYDPREDLLYRIEAPYGIVRDDDRRERITQWVLQAVAAERGPPAPIAKADELARIDRSSTAALRQALAEGFGTEQARRYDDLRWNAHE